VAMRRRAEACIQAGGVRDRPQKIRKSAFSGLYRHKLFFLLSTYEERIPEVLVCTFETPCIVMCDC
jgi:hypothetical protein